MHDPDVLLNIGCKHLHLPQSHAGCKIGLVLLCIVAFNAFFQHIHNSGGVLEILRCLCFLQYNLRRPDHLLCVPGFVDVISSGCCRSAVDDHRRTRHHCTGCKSDHTGINRLTERCGRFGVNPGQAADADIPEVSEKFLDELARGFLQKVFEHCIGCNCFEESFLCRLRCGGFHCILRQVTGHTRADTPDRLEGRAADLLHQVFTARRQPTIDVFLESKLSCLVDSFTDGVSENPNAKHDRTSPRRNEVEQEYGGLPDTRSGIRKELRYLSGGISIRHIRLPFPDVGLFRVVPRKTVISGEFRSCRGHQSADALEHAAEPCGGIATDVCQVAEEG